MKQHSTNAMCLLMGKMSSRIYIYTTARGTILCAARKCWYCCCCINGEKRTAFEMKASEETDAFGFDLCLLHLAVPLKGFKVVISGIMVCYFVSSRGAKHSLLWGFLHRISQPSIVIQNSVRSFVFIICSGAFVK